MRTQTAQLKALGQVPLFAGLSKADLKFILKQLNEETFSQGRNIIEEEQPGARFFVILEGTVNVVVGGKSRKSLGPGAYFGELALLDGGSRTATVVAATPVVTLSLTSWNFLSTLQENWPVTKKILASMARRIRELDKSHN
ncbi:MAG: cyclic nucleotide-binding domain-containing protein [Actinomycetota bacterium]